MVINLQFDKTYNSFRSMDLFISYKTYKAACK